MSGGEQPFVEQDFVVFTTKTSDLPGNPLEGTLQECMDKCINNSDCVAFSRQKNKKDTDKAKCWLKKDIINNPKTANNSEWKTFVKQQEEDIINNPKTANNSEWKTFVKQQEEDIINNSEWKTFVEDYLIYIIVLVVILLVMMSLSSALVFFVMNKKRLISKN
jgi:hypothetical protein